MGVLALDFSNRSQAFSTGVLHALSQPALVLMLSMLAYGVLARDSGLSLTMALFSSGAMWALPGQIAHAEMLAADASLVAIVFAVGLINLRFIPMTASILPILKPGVKHPLWLLLSAQLTAITSWLWGMRYLPQIQPELRLAYYAGLGLTCIALSLVGTLAGYWLVDRLPSSVAVALLFFTPLYMSLLLVNVREAGSQVAIVVGALLGPLAFQYSSDWYLVFAAVAAGSVGFLVSRSGGGAA